MSDFMLPDIGEGIVECEVVKWLVSEGETISEDQPVAEVMTDKALVEIPAPYAGKVTRLYYQEGEIARVHAPLFALVAEGEAEDDDQGKVAATPPDKAPGSEPGEAAPEPSASAGEVTAVGKDFILPDIGEGIVECEIVEWRIAEGETVAEDQPVVDVMTDKAMVEITAPEAGRVTRLHYGQGESARVHTPLFAYLPEGGEAEAASPQPAQGAAQRQAAAPARGAAPAQPTPVKETQEPVKGKGSYGRTPASPAVRRLVREHGLTLATIPGSGKDGRVLKEDVLRYLESPQGGEKEPATASQPSPTPDSARAGGAPQGEVRVEPLRGVQAAMAKRMVASAQSIPHFAYGDEFDVTELVTLRERLKVKAEARGARLTLMPFFMKALALAALEYPILNSRLDEAAAEIHYLPEVNVGMAVDGKAGLIVPNVKRVERLSLLEIAAEVSRLTEAAREGRVAPSDLTGGTVTISNIGALGGTYAVPIINAPEAAIVAIGKTQWLPRFDADGQVVRRAIMTATWCGDHRLIDGGTIARFANAWKGYLEDPESLLLAL
ncbi:dihydrolipoamide acetyltransferase component of pyruvate dehydrogenase complex [Bisbaumannia pacifica]|uniref:Dihydrolipoamide acetyltransferase component of pyruvate dehydrogenase complex n=1 Tax=Bisbaumannia pacifica TaxID=77098 RepID=A0A510X5L8_9GAMM|nr:dihydrolipoyllysine-residue acetyltransferase [Halomonas pacifica]GEK46067.1 dihydrolipoamide acetyltransferase component of pyruvate dehydrogenase complex [Halomonas pacifica]